VHGGPVPLAALEGIERPDGPLFVRVWTHIDWLGWTVEVEKAGLWDLDGIPMLEVHAFTARANV